MDVKKSESTTAATPSKLAPSTNLPVEKKSVLELLEEDDEFEEFEGTTWEDQVGNSNEDKQLWKDDWEDDDVNDDFAQQLRAQIESRK